jgi:tRNA threonylcarbamoyladenosine biosynthesis protein TsaE
MDMSIIFSEKEIPNIAKKILEKIYKPKKVVATIVALSGDLGSGKTTLTKEIAKQLGIKKNLISPTFVIMKIYEINSKSEYFSKFKNLIHIDAYRLESHLELLNIGWDKIIENKDNLVILEWPEMVEACLSDDVCNVKLNHIDEQKREISF